MNTNALIWSVNVEMLRFGKKIDMETSSCSVSKCKLVSGGRAGPHQSGQRTEAILWSGKHCQTVFKECSVLWVNHNFSLLWVHVPVPGVSDIGSRCQHLANKWCLPTSIQQLQNYVLCRRACICPLTNIYQATPRVLKFLLTKSSAFLLCQQIPTKQCPRRKVSRVLLGLDGFTSFICSAMLENSL